MADRDPGPLSSAVPDALRAQLRAIVREEIAAQFGSGKAEVIRKLEAADDDPPAAASCGQARLGLEWQGAAGKARTGEARRVSARHGVAGFGRQGGRVLFGAPSLRHID
jgi:hypothetical protein